MERHVGSDGIVEVVFIARRTCGIGVPAEEIPTVCCRFWLHQLAAAQHADGINGITVSVHIEIDRIKRCAYGNLGSVLIPSQYEAVVVKREIGVGRCRVVCAVAARHRNGRAGGRYATSNTDISPGSQFACNSQGRIQPDVCVGIIRNDRIARHENAVIQRLYSDSVTADLTAGYRNIAI